MAGAGAVLCGMSEGIDCFHASPFGDEMRQSLLTGRQRYTNRILILGKKGDRYNRNIECALWRDDHQISLIDILCSKS